MKNLSLKRTKQKTKKRKQMGGELRPRFWKQLILGRFFGVGGPSKSRSKPKPKSKPKPQPEPKQEPTLSLYLNTETPGALDRVDDRIDEINNRFDTLSEVHKLIHHF